jgi:phosphogluconate dehydratase
VVRQQGPRANGMPELHKLTPLLGVLQDRGFQVALVTDGRMSGASGKVPAAIHVTPEMVMGGPIGKVREGDLITLDCDQQRLTVEVDPAEWAARPNAPADTAASARGNGRDLFALFRAHAASAEAGASPLLELFGDAS